MRTPNDIGDVELEDPLCNGDCAVIRMQPSLQGLAAPEEHSGNLSGIDKSRLLELGH